MNVKKQSGKKRLFLLVLVAFGIVLWITFTNLNRIALRHTLDEMIGFVKFAFSSTKLMRPTTA